MRLLKHYLAWLIGKEWIVCSGKPRYGDSPATLEAYHWLDKDESACLVYTLESGKTVRIDLDREQMTIGSSFAADITVDSADMDSIQASISRKVQESGGRRYYLRALSETKPVLVNGRPIPVWTGEENDLGQEIREGDTIGLSNLTLWFRDRFSLPGERPVPGECGARKKQFSVPPQTNQPDDSGGSTGKA